MGLGSGGQSQVSRWEGGEPIAYESLMRVVQALGADWGEFYRIRDGEVIPYDDECDPYGVAPDGTLILLNPDQPALPGGTSTDPDQLSIPNGYRLVPIDPSGWPVDDPMLDEFMSWVPEEFGKRLVRFLSPLDFVTELIVYGSEQKWPTERMGRLHAKRRELVSAR